MHGRYYTYLVDVSGSISIMDKKDLTISRGIIPGYENGNYEPARHFDQAELKSHSLEDPKRRDNRISIRVSGKDMEALHKLSLEEGVPSQSLIANIVHKYVNGLLLDMSAASHKKLSTDTHQSPDCANE